MLADIVTALCLLYLASSLADPSSLNSTKLARDISLPDVSDLTKIFDMPSLFKLLRCENKKIIAFPIYEDWIDVGRPNDLKNANTSKFSSHNEN
mgnify:CR=1 FL=1